jgi:hypothetical protein
VTFGPVNARTDPETGLRFYSWEGREYPSVTSIRRLIGMPFTLHNWALSQVIDRAIVDHELIDAMLKRPRRPRERVRDKNVITEVSQHLRRAATEERDMAGDRGTRAHEAIRLGMTPEQVAVAQPDILGHVCQFQDFMQTQQAQMVWQERQIWNLTYGYAGSADALMKFPNGRLFCVDYKTSRGVYIDHAIQLVAYGMGEFVGENGVVDRNATAQLLAADGLGILHLSESAWEWIEVKPEPVIFQGFVGALAFARFLHMKDNSIDPLVAHRKRGGTLVPALAASLNLIPGTTGGTTP